MKRWRAGIALLALSTCTASAAGAQPPAAGAQPPAAGAQPPADGAQLPAPEGPPARPEPPADASATALLAAAEEAMTSIDYAAARRLVERALSRGGLGLEEVIRAHELLAVSCAQLDAAEPAEQAFRRLFALAPRSNVASRLSPERRTAALNARGFWAVRNGVFALEVNLARRERQVVAEVKDPLRWGRTVHLWSRLPDRSYLKAQAPAAPEVVFDIADLGATDPLEVYAFVTDEHQNVLMQFGRERVPHLFGLSEEELAEILRRDIRGGQTGSYARRLDELGVAARVHGYVSLEYKEAAKVSTFDLHHATIMIQADLHRAASVELAFEYEHLGRGAGDFYLPHAFLDLKLHQALILRGGYFEVPVGAFNEYLYPDFLRITALPPLFSRGVVPALWSEVGLQLRGRVAFGARAAFTYALFIGNGLEQADAMPADGIVQEGGDLRGMRFNDRDEFSEDKAVGGRLGLELGEFDLGVSGYRGRYTVERPRRLGIVDADLSYRGRWLTLRTEGAVAHQQTTGRTLRKYGLYALVAARPGDHLEPYAQYDLVDIDLGSRLQRGLAGLALYPFPRARETRNLRLKSEGGYEFPEGGGRLFVWFFQLTTGF